MYLQPLVGLLEGQLKCRVHIYQPPRKHLSCLFTGRLGVKPRCCVVTRLGSQRRSLLLFPRTQLYDSCAISDTGNFGSSSTRNERETVATCSLSCKISTLLAASACASSSTTDFSYAKRNSQLCLLSVRLRYAVAPEASAFPIVRLDRPPRPTHPTPQDSERASMPHKDAAVSPCYPPFPCCRANSIDRL